MNIEGILAVDCGDPTMNISLAKIEYLSGSSSGLLTYQSSKQLTCQPGFRWSDSFSVKNITCQANQIWTSIIPCIGKNRKKLFP